MRCNAATALATVNGNEIRYEKPLSHAGREGAESRQSILALSQDTGLLSASLPLFRRGGEGDTHEEN